MADYREGERVMVWVAEHPLHEPGWFEGEVGTVGDDARLSILVSERDEEPPHEEWWIGTLRLGASDLITRVFPLR